MTHLILFLGILTRTAVSWAHLKNPEMYQASDFLKNGL